MVTLLCLSPSAEGGTSWIASVGRIYNELASTRPDLIRTLSEPWPVDRFGLDPKYRMRPVLFYEDGHAIVRYTRRSFTGFGEKKRTEGIPPITEDQAEAVDALQFLAEKYAMSFQFQKGDIQIINKLGLLHARDGFRDTPDQTRHLLRGWHGNDELAWPTPEPLQSGRKDIYYSLKPEEQVIPLEPLIRKNASEITK